MIVLLDMKYLDPLLTDFIFIFILYINCTLTDYLNDAKFWEEAMKVMVSKDEVDTVMNNTMLRNSHDITRLFKSRLDHIEEDFDNLNYRSNKDHLKNTINLEQVAHSFERSDGKFEYRKSWMASIDDKMWLSEMSIPGTHDTMTSSDHPDNTCNNFIVSRCCQTQDLSLREQLDAGIRFVDLRLKHENNDLILHHDFITIGPNLKHVLEVLTTFLKENPTETIIMSYQQTQQSENSNGVPFHKDFRKQVREVPDNFMYSEYRMPQLSEVRGKIVLLDWMRNGGLGLGKKKDYVDNYWDNIVEWDWIMWNVKAEYFERLQNNIAYSQSKYDSKHFFVSWLSANDCKKTLLNWGPRKCAANVNPEMHNYLMEQSGKGNFGVIVMDFPNDWIIRTIVENNSKP